MAVDDQPVLAALVMDRSSPLGNSEGPDGRRRLHTFVANGGGEPIPVSGSFQVSFPTTLATSANQESEIYLLQQVIDAVTGTAGGGASGGASEATLQLINQKLTAPINVAVTGILPLPMGAATAANQVTGNASLASIDQKLTSPLSVSQFGTWNVGSVTGSITLPTGAATESTLQNISQKLAAPINVAVTGALPLAAGAATSVLQVSGNNLLASIDSKLTPPLYVAEFGTWNIGSVTGTVSLPTGAATETTLQLVNQKLAAPVNVAVTGALPLPAGAATDATLQLINQKLAAPVNVAVTGSLPPITIQNPTTSVGVTGNVSVVQGSAWTVGTIGSVTGTISLPTGAATSLLQASGNVFLASIDSKLSTPLPVVVLNPANPIGVTGNVSVVQGSNWTITTLGSITGAISLPTGAATAVLQQATVNAVTGSSTGGASGGATEATLQLINQKLAAPVNVAVTGSLPPITILNAVTAVGVTGNVSVVQGSAWTVNTLGSVTGSITLPTGAATATLQQATINAVTGSSSGGASGGASEATLQLINQKLAAPVNVAVTGTLPLAVGAATSALQVSGNNLLSQISGFLTPPLSVSQFGTWNIGAVTGSVTLPTGAATEATLQLINQKLAAPVNVAVTGTLPLSTGAATSANQLAEIGLLQADINAATGNGATLSLINQKLAAPVNVAVTGTLPLPIGATNLGTQVSGNNLLSQIAGYLTPPLAVNVGSVTGSVTLPTGASTSANQLVEIGLLQADINAATGNGATLNLINQKLAAPVNVAVTGTLPLPTGAATSALQTTGNASLSSIDTKLTPPLSVSQFGTWNLGAVTGSVTLPTGAATALLQVSGNSALSSIQSTSNSTAVNTATIISNQTNGSQKVQLTDGAGSLFQVTKIDTANSTAIALGSNGTFTGAAFTDVSNYSTLSVLVFTDQASATNGLTIQYSSDGTNIDDTDQYTIPASNGQQYSFPLPGRYFRIFYTNGSVAQTAFRLQAKVHSTPIKASSHRLGSPLNYEQDAEVIMSAPARLSLTASAPTGVTIGTTSVQVVPANLNRKGLVFTNLSTNATYYAMGTTAVTGRGITLYPGGTWEMDELTFNTGAITAIAAAASTPIAIQEFS